MFNSKEIKNNDAASKNPTPLTEMNEVRLQIDSHKNRVNVCVDFSNNPHWKSDLLMQVYVEFQSTKVKFSTGKYFPSDDFELLPEELDHSDYIDIKR